jgi:alpha-galactosidase
VLDDGWFGQRDDDTQSLSDWEVDPRKYPDGLGPA